MSAVKLWKAITAAALVWSGCNEPVCVFVSDWPTAACTIQGWSHAWPASPQHVCPHAASISLINARKRKPALPRKGRFDRTRHSASCVCLFLDEREGQCCPCVTRRPMQHPAGITNFETIQIIPLTTHIKHNPECPTWKSSNEGIKDTLLCLNSASVQN